MRLVDWTEFRSLPLGAIFQEWHPHDLGSLQILGGVDGDTFVTAELMPSCIEGENLEYGHPLKNAGELIAMPSGFGRDGQYEHEQRRWLVWDESDRKRLAHWLLDPATALNLQNEDDVLYVISSPS